MSEQESAPEDAASMGVLDRLLNVVTEVKAGEGGTALLLTFNIFLLLLAYYLIKPVREALILAMPSGAEYKSYMGGAIALGLLAAVPAYSAFAKRVPRNRLVVAVTLFFASHLVGFFALSQVAAVASWLGLLFYLWVGIFNMMVIAQAWAFAADIYTEEQGTRLFALIGVGASLGSAVGSLIGVALSNALGVMSMLLVSAAVLVVIAGLTQVVHLRESRGDRATTNPKPEKPKEQAAGAFALVFRHKYLRWLAYFSVVFTLVNTNGEYMLGSLVSELAEGVESSGELAEGMSRGDFIGAWYSEFFLYVNVLGLILQFFVVSRLIKHAGLKVAFLILPAIALFDVSMVAVLPAIGILRWGKTAENATDYSLNNTVRNMLWLPTTKDMKYRAKQAVDTFFVRMGDVGSALLVMLLTGVLGLGVQTFAAVSAVFVLAWFVIAWRLLAERDVLLAAKSADGEPTL